MNKYYAVIRDRAGKAIATPWLEEESEMDRAIASAVKQAAMEGLGGGRFVEVAHA